MKKDIQEETISLLLSGKHPEAKKYVGKHVLAIESEIIPLKKGQGSIKDLDRLEKKYGKTPTIVFVPKPNITYIW